MDKQNRFLLYSIHFALSLIVEIIIVWLFPYTGLAGLVCWPLTILFALILGFLIFKISKRKLKLLQIILIFITIFTFQIILQLWTTPQDSGGTTFYKIGDAIRSYKNYNKIEYNNFLGMTSAERIVYIYKYKDKLPNSFIILQIDSIDNNYESINQRTYIIENRNDRLLYDTTKLKIFENDTSTIIIEYNQDSLLHKMNKNFLKIKAGGWGNNGLNINVNEDEFKIIKGIDQLLFNILEITKKPTR